MSLYAFAIGNDNEVGLTVLTVQPASPGLLPGDLVDPGDGSRFARGTDYTEWIYGPQVDEVLLPTILSEVGLTSYWSRACTITTLIDASRSVYGNFNATIVKKPFRYEGGFWNGVEFILRDLRQL